MRVVTGLRPLFPGRIGGHEVYVRELLREWGDWARDDEWIVLVNEESAASFTPPGPWMKFVTVPGVHDLAGWSRVAESFGPALYFSPMLVIDPPSVGLPTVVNIPDLQHDFFPNYFDADTLAMRRVHFPLSARRAAAVLTQSAHARTTIVERYGIPADRVHGIQLAAGDEYRRPANTARIAAFLDKYHLPQIFGYFPANFWPHKNHATLFKALALYRRQFGPPPVIALSGFSGDRLAAVEAAIRAHGLQENIRILGFLDRAEVPVAYQAAHFLIFPSRFEGFGLPVAEAMAAGCPVICSDIPSLAEFAGDAALTCAADNAGAYAAAIHRLMTDDGLRQSLARRGSERSAELTWKRTAELSHAALRGVWDRWQQRPQAAVRIIIWPPAQDAQIPPLTPAEPAPILQFSTGGGELPDPRLAQRFAESGLDALIAPVDGVPPEPFDLIRLKSGDSLPLNRLRAGPALSLDLIAWLARHPGATNYEVALRIVTNGMTAQDSALAPVPAAAVAPLTGRTGLHLSAKYFGEIDAGWLRRAGEASIADFPFIGRWKRAQRHAGRLLSAWHHLRLTGRPPPGLQRALLARLRPPPAAAPTADGWIGRNGEITLRPAADGTLRLRLELPAWPLPRPPAVRIRRGQRVLYRGVLRQPGIYAFCWGWPEGETSVQLNIHATAVCVPAEHGLGSDARELSVRVLKD